MTIASDIQKLAPGNLVELFELDASAIGGTVYRFHAGTNELQSPVVWQGNIYTPYPVEASGFEWSGRGTLPQPQVRVANIFGLISALCLQHDDLVGAKLIRRRTFVKYLDAINFSGVNLYTYSEQFGHANWTKYNASVAAAPAVPAPDGTATASKLIAVVGQAEHVVIQDVTVSVPGPVGIASIYFRQAEYRYGVIRYYQPSMVGYVCAVFDLQLGTVVYESSDIISTGIESVGNGWYRCYAAGIDDFLTTGKIYSQFIGAPAVNASATHGYNGDGVSGVYAWGAQLEVWPGLHNNMVNNPEAFGTGWTPTYCTVTTNAIAAPDGSVTAEKLTEATGTGNHGVTKGVAGVNIGNTYTASIHVKAAGCGFAYFWMDNGAGVGHTLELNLSTGDVRFTRLTSGIYYTATSGYAVETGDGWWRMVMTTTPLQYTSMEMRLYMSRTQYTSGAYGTPSYAGDNISGISAWGAKFELGSGVTAYVPMRPDTYQKTAATHNPTADPTAGFADEVWFINRKSGENKIFAEFELSTSFDVQGVKIPRRQTIQNVCPWKYKSAECGYVPGAMFTDADVSTANPALDKCGKRLASCKLRFGTYAQLPYGGFPGVGLTR